MLPVAVRMATRISSRSLIASNTMISSSRVRAFCAFTGGRSKVTVAMPSATSTRNWVRSMACSEPALPHRHPVHGENIVDRGVIHVAETGDRPDARHVYIAVDNHRIVDVHVDHFAD